MFYRLIKYLRSQVYRIRQQRSFKSFGRKTRIIRPLQIIGKKYIHLEDNVYVASCVNLICIEAINGLIPYLTVGEGTSIGNSNHIVVTGKMVIGRNVLTADRVYISDNIHKYEDIDMPIKDQGIIHKKDVVIGDGTWIGENACIIGASLGRNVIVGANSVVTKDVPDYCVVVGIPARIIKRYNGNTKQWEKVKF